MSDSVEQTHHANRTQTADAEAGPYSQPPGPVVSPVQLLSGVRVASRALPSGLFRFSWRRGLALGLAGGDITGVSRHVCRQRLQSFIVESRRIYWYQPYQRLTSLRSLVGQGKDLPFTILRFSIYAPQKSSYGCRLNARSSGRGSHERRAKVTTAIPPADEGTFP